ncbi:MAG: hypothetical protein MUC96_06545 [Myxococcaceae bacterium]|jgi:hypothetical protein|nr:hypothetical protein [Myxococcaceae bacterium]
MLGSLLAVALAQAPVVLPAGAPVSFSAASVPWPILADAGFAAAHDGLGFRLVWVDARRVLGDGTQAEVWSARPDGAEAAMLFETNMGEGVSNLQLVGLGDGGVVVGTEVRSVGNAVVQFRVRSGGLSSVVAPAVQPNSTALVRLADGGLTGAWLTDAGVTFRSGPLPSLPVTSSQAGTFRDGPALGGQGAAAVWAANSVGVTFRRGTVGSSSTNGTVLGQVIAVTDGPPPVPPATLIVNNMGLYNDDWPTMVLRTNVSLLPRPVAALVGDRVVVLYRTVSTPLRDFSISIDPARMNSLVEGEATPVHPRLLAGARDGGLAVEWGPMLGFRSYPITLDAMGGPTFGAPLRLPPQPAPQRRPSVVWGGGRFFVAWDQFTLTSSWQAFVSSIDPLGVAGSVSAVGPLGGPPNDPQLVQNPAGGVELFSIGTPGSRRGVALVNGTVDIQPANPTADDTSGGVVVGQNTTLAWSRTALTVGGVDQMLIGPPPTCVSRVGGEFRYFSRGSTGDLVLVVIPDVAISPMRTEVAAASVAPTPGPICTSARSLPDGGSVTAGVWGNAQVTSLVVREGQGPLSVVQLPGVSTVEPPRVVPFAGAGW